MYYGVGLPGYLWELIQRLKKMLNRQFCSGISSWGFAALLVFVVNSSKAQDDDPFAVIFNSAAIETSGRVVIEQEGPCFDFPGGRSCQLKLAGVSIQKHGKNISLFQSNITISPNDNDEYIAITGLGKDGSFGVRAFIPEGGCIDNTEIPDREKFREILSKAQIFVICDEDDDPSPGTAEIEGTNSEHFIFDQPEIDFGIVPLGFVHFRQISGRNASDQTRTLLLTDDLEEFSAYEDLGDGVKGDPIEVLEVPPGPFSFYGAYRPKQFNLDRQIVISELEKLRTVDLLIRGSSPPSEPLEDEDVRAKIEEALRFKRIVAGGLNEEIDLGPNPDYPEIDAFDFHTYLLLQAPRGVTVEPGDDRICEVGLDRFDFQVRRPIDLDIVETNLRCWTGDFLKPVVLKKRIIEEEEEINIGVSAHFVFPDGALRHLDFINIPILAGEIKDDLVLAENFGKDVISVDTYVDSEATVVTITEQALATDSDTIFISTEDPLSREDLAGLDVKLATSSGEDVILTEIDNLIGDQKKRNKGLNDSVALRAWTWDHQENVEYKLTVIHPADQPIKIKIGVAPLSVLQGSSLFLPGDCNRDAVLNMADAICLLSHLFLGEPNRLPCGDGPVDDPANIAIFDLNGQAGVDASDAIHLLVHLFLGGPGPIQGNECIEVTGCPNSCG